MRRIMAMRRRNYKEMNIVENNCVTVTTDLPNFNEGPFRGTFQQLLSLNVGRPVKIDFMLGTGNMVSYSGVIDSVGVQYVILRQANKNVYFSGDIFAIKFITFFC